MKQSSIKPPFLEWIKDDKGNTLAMIVRKECNPAKTQFFTPDEYNQQIGFVVYPKGGEVVTHMHLPVDRRVTGTSEVLIVRNGRAVIRFYKTDKTFVAKRELEPGDLVLLVSGWHGMDFLEDTVVIEVKQGPYLGVNEKVKFEKGECFDSGK